MEMKHYSFQQQVIFTGMILASQFHNNSLYKGSKAISNSMNNDFLISQTTKWKEWPKQKVTMEMKTDRQIKVARTFAHQLIRMKRLFKRWNSKY